MSKHFCFRFCVSMKQTAERMMFKFENIFQVNQLQHNIQE